MAFWSSRPTLSLEESQRLNALRDKYGASQALATARRRCPSLAPNGYDTPKEEERCEQTLKADGAPHSGWCVHHFGSKGSCVKWFRDNQYAGHSRTP